MGMWRSKGLWLAALAATAGCDSSAGPRGPSAGTTSDQNSASPAGEGAPSSEQGIPDAASGTATGTEPAPGAVPESAPSCDVLPIFQAKCQTCHGVVPAGAPQSLVSYEDFIAPGKINPAKSMLELIGERIHHPVMPMPPAAAEPLTPEELASIDAWLAAGAPAAEDPSCGGTNVVVEPEDTEPVSDAGEEPPPVTDAMVDVPRCDVAPIFRDKCQGCHDDPPSLGAPGPLVRHQDFLGQGIYTPTRPVLELIGERIVSTTSPMPPLSSPQLTDAEKAAITDWIAAGAPKAQDPTCGGSFAPPVPEADAAADTPDASAPGPDAASGGAGPGPANASNGSGASTLSDASALGDANGSTPEDGGTAPSDAGLLADAASDGQAAGPAECASYPLLAHAPGNLSAPLQIPGGQTTYAQITLDAPWGDASVHAVELRPVLPQPEAILAAALYDLKSGRKLVSFTGEDAASEWVLDPAEAIALSAGPRAFMLTLTYDTRGGATLSDQSGVELCVIAEAGRRARDTFEAQ